MGEGGHLGPRSELHDAAAGTGTDRVLQLARGPRGGGVSDTACRGFPPACQAEEEEKGRKKRQEWQVGPEELRSRARSRTDGEGARRRHEAHEDAHGRGFGIRWTWTVDPTR